MRGLAGHIEGCAESAQSAGDHHGMHDTPIDVDTCKPSCVNVLTDRTQFIALAGSVQQMCDDQCGNDCNEKARIDICPAKGFL